MFEVFKSVSSSNTCGGIAPHLGKSAPFRVGQSSNPYLPHYRTAFASSRIFYLHGISPSLAVGILRDLRLAPPGEPYRLTAYRRFHKMGLGRLCIPDGAASVQVRRQNSPA
jgi:hypothetical protein